MGNVFIVDQSNQMQGRTGTHSRGQVEASPYGSEGEEYNRSGENEVETTDRTHRGSREGKSKILCRFEADLLLAWEVRSGIQVKAYE